MDKYADNIIQVIIRILIHSSFCVLNFMLPTCKTNFGEVVRTTYEAERAWSRSESLKKKGKNKQPNRNRRLSIIHFV